MIALRSKKTDVRQNWPRVAGVCLLLLVGLILGACDDNKSPEDVRNSVKTALAITDSTPAPTLNQAKYLGGNIGIVNLREFYPENPQETIHFVINNGNATSFFTGTCGTPTLQRLAGSNWLDIAPAKPCAPSGPRIFQITAFSKPYTADFVFDNRLTRPFAGQSWNVSGTYRLYFTYYLTCPPGSDLVKDCVDTGHIVSEEFQIKSGSTVTIQANPNYVSPTRANPTVHSTP